MCDEGKNFKEHYNLHIILKKIFLKMHPSPNPVLLLKFVNFTKPIIFYTYLWKAISSNRFFWTLYPR